MTLCVFAVDRIIDLMTTITMWWWMCGCGSDVCCNSGACQRPTLYRPPYGSTSELSRGITSRMGYMAVGWNLDTKDWDMAASNPQALLQYYEESLLSLGDIGIMHLQHDLINASVDLFPSVRGRCCAVSPHT